MSDKSPTIAELSRENRELLGRLRELDEYVSSELSAYKEKVEKNTRLICEERDAVELELRRTERELDKVNKRLEKKEARIGALRSDLEDAKTASDNNRDGIHRLLCLEGEPTWSAVRREVARLSNYVITDDADGLRVELREVPEDCAIKPEPNDNDCDGISPLCFPAIKPSVPEPDPKPSGVEVTPGLVAWLRDRGMNYVAELVEARDAFGRSKYGQPLMTDDGRDAVEDCRQELGDALQYAWSAKLCGDDVTGLLGPAQALVQLLFEKKIVQSKGEVETLSDEDLGALFSGMIKAPVTVEPGIRDPEAALMAAAVYSDVTKPVNDEDGLDRDVLMAWAEVEPEMDAVECPAVTTVTTPEPEPEPVSKPPMVTASNEVLDVKLLDAGFIEKPESVYVLFLQREAYEGCFETIGAFRTEEAAIHVAGRILDDAQGRGLKVKRSGSDNAHWSVGSDGSVWIEEVPFGKPSKVRF